MATPRLSIVIPTADRHYLLEKTIAGCLLTDYPNIEILVSDNFSSPETGRIIQSFSGDPRVRCVRTDRRLSMPDHWEFAWKRATGDYVIITGDDDGVSSVLPTQLASLCAKTNAGLVSWDRGLYYHPDWNLPGTNTFTFMTGHSRLVAEIDPLALIEAYARLDFPICFPHGSHMCFSRLLAERVASKVGRLFWPPYPDYSAPLLLSAMLEDRRYYYIDALLGFGGRSRYSNAAAWERQGEDVGDPQRQKEFIAELDSPDMYPHHELKFTSMVTGHAETHNLLRELLPEVFGRHRLSQVAFIAALECEFRGVNINNAFIGPREREMFEAYLRRQDPEVVAQAMREADARERIHKAAKWRPVVAASVRGRIAQVVSGTFLEAPLRELARLVFSPSSTTAGGSQLFAGRRTRRSSMGRMLRIECADMDCRDSLDLTQILPQISEAFDPIDWTNIINFFRSGLARATFVPPSAG